MEEKSSFRCVFGDTPVVKVIDFFLDNREFDYSLTDVARNADVGWSTLHKFWKEFVKLGLVVKTRRIGRAELYRLNRESPIVRKLTELDFNISKRLLDAEFGKRKAKITA